MKVTIENNELVVSMPLEKPTLSASGKTMVVASSRGNQKTGVMVEGKEVIIGFNAYTPK
jgi:hypothetical protein